MVGSSRARRDARGDQASDRGQPLGTGGPVVGSTLHFDGQDWQVTGRSNYRSDEGYRVAEWQCEAEGASASLLRETDEKRQIRWFFTREIGPEEVTLAAGEAFPAWLERTPAAEPPEALTYQGQTYRYDDMTEGTHEDESGTRIAKTTWDYWDPGHVHNLAVERWEGGGLGCYHGAYIEPGEVTLRPRAARAGPFAAKKPNPFVAAGVALPAAYVLAFIVGRPFDQAIAFALPAAGVVGWLVAWARAPVPGLATLVLVPLLAFLFWRFPPLTSAAGIAAFFGAPAIVAWWGRTADPGDEVAAVVYSAAAAVALPLLVLGLMHYFRFAPGPHTSGQLFLALGPAGLSGLAACVVAAVVLRFGSSSG